MNGSRLLIVDDEVDILNALVRLLRHEGYTVFPANNAKIALHLLEKYAIDLVISDYRMQPVDGVSFLEKVSRNFPDVITIMLTGHADMRVAIDAINRMNLYKFLLKPWDNHELKLTVKRAIEARQLIIENRRLMDALKERDQIIKEIETKHPGITTVVRDEEGRILIDEAPMGGAKL